MWKGVLAEIENDAKAEPITQPVAQPGEMASGVAAGRRARLDLDGDDPAVASLEDEVDLPAVTVSEVIDGGRRLRQRRGLGELAEDEGLEEAAKRGVTGPAESLRGRRDEAGGQPGIGEVCLGGFGDL